MSCGVQPMTPHGTRAVVSSAALPLATALRRVVRTLPAYLIASQHFAGATMIYLAVFFQPLMLKELLPSLTKLAIAALHAIPVALAIPVGIGVSAWGDLAPAGVPRLQRRAATLWGSGLGASTLLTISGLLLVHAAAFPSGSIPKMHLSIGALVCQVNAR